MSKTYFFEKLLFYKSVKEEFVVSTGFFEFKITCPNCRCVETKMDGFETDDWAEVFVFSGYSLKSCSNASVFQNTYTCPQCKTETNIDVLYQQRYISTECIEKIKAYLSRMLIYVIEEGGLYDHGWEPDLLTAIHRYSLLFPDDAELNQIKVNYYHAIHNPKYFTKFEPVPGTSSIGPEMINSRYLLEKVYLHDGLKEIKRNTFSSCARIRDVFIPETVFILGEEVFSGCTGMESVHLPKKITKIPDGFFKECHALKKCFLSDDIEEIGKEAFLECYKLSNPWIPKHLKKIGELAFCGCSALTELLIPEGVLEIGSRAFDGCPNLTLKCFAGSVAEGYAKENNLPFVVLNC